MASRTVVAPVIPGYVPTTPPIPIDPALNAGSVLLVEPGHPYLADLTSVPTDGALVENLAWEQAAEVFGGTKASLSPAFHRNAAAAELVMQRTSKGGWHFVPSKVNDVAGQGAWLSGFTTLLDWFATQRTHGRYMALWARVTRAGVAGTTTPYLVRFASQQGTIVAQAFSEGSAGTSVVGIPSGGAEYLGRANATTPGLGRFDSGVSSMISTWPTTGNVAALPAFLYAGPVVGTLHKQPSWIFYRLHIVDLSVAGQTYAQAAAIDAAQFTAAFSPGGRYYGDTWTDPATILP